MKKNLLFLITLFIGLTSCYSQDISSPKTVTDTRANEDYIIYRISNQIVFDTSPEQINNPKFNTITLKKGFITSKFTSSLGKFENAKRFDLNIQITRKTEDPKFEEGVFKLVGPSVAVFPKNSDFGVINAIDYTVYQTLKTLGQLNEIENKFVLLPDDDNEVVLEKVEDFNDPTLIAGNIPGGSQKLHGYAQMKLMEVNTGEVFFIRIDFHVINDIRLKM
ncbi:hypothetical protein [Aquimarina sp. 2304DJ70-9]|uniref:hypothetical protein n=1 Tax=Aquimarina penaris TaxID=3231044 RepID=UPI003462C48F